MSPPRPFTLHGSGATPVASRASLALLLGCRVLLGCQCDADDERPDAHPSGAASAQTQPHASAPRSSSAPSASSPAAHRAIDPRLLDGAPCRAMRVVASVTQRGSSAANDAGTPLHRSQGLSGDAWLSLGDGASLSVKHGTSAREYTLDGPGVALPCHEASEQVLLAAGTFRASPGPGARPGAMVLVATPHAVVRYGNANLTVRVAATQTDVLVQTGPVWVEAAQGARRSGPEKLNGPAQRTRVVGTVVPAQRIDVCEKDAKRAEQSALAVVRGPTSKGDHSKSDGPESEPSLGERAAAQLRDRMAARSACLVARAALQTSGNPDKTPDLLARLDRADTAWRKVPANVPTGGDRARP